MSSCNLWASRKHAIGGGAKRYLAGIAMFFSSAGVLAACSSSAPVATFQIPSGPSRLIALSADVPVMKARLDAFGDRQATVVVQGQSIVIKGGGPLPAPSSFFTELGAFTFRPVLCSAVAYSGPSASGTLPTCSSDDALTPSNLNVNTNTGQPMSSIPPDPAFANFPSTTADNDIRTSNVLLPGPAPSMGGGYPRYVLGPAELANAGIASAQVASIYSGGWTIMVNLTAAGAQSWNQLAQQSFHSYVAIDLDGAVISAPLIEPNSQTFVSFGARDQISGGFSKKQARQIAALLNAKPLPVPLVLSK